MNCACPALEHAPAGWIARARAKLLAALGAALAVLGALGPASAASPDQRTPLSTLTTPIGANARLVTLEATFSREIFTFDAPYEGASTDWELHLEIADAVIGDPAQRPRLVVSLDGTPIKLTNRGNSVSAILPGSAMRQGRHRLIVGLAPPEGIPCLNASQGAVTFDLERSYLRPTRPLPRLVSLAELGDRMRADLAVPSGVLLEPGKLETTKAAQTGAFLAQALAARAWPKPVQFESMDAKSLIGPSVAIAMAPVLIHRAMSAEQARVITARLDLGPGDPVAVARGFAANARPQRPIELLEGSTPISRLRQIETGNPGQVRLLFAVTSDPTRLARASLRLQAERTQGIRGPVRLDVRLNGEPIAQPSLWRPNAQTFVIRLSPPQLRPGLNQIDIAPLLDQYCGQAPVHVLPSSTIEVIEDSSPRAPDLAHIRTDASPFARDRGANAAFVLDARSPADVAAIAQLFARMTQVHGASFDLAWTGERYDQAPADRNKLVIAPLEALPPELRAYADPQRASARMLRDANGRIVAVISAPEAQFADAMRMLATTDLWNALHGRYMAWTASGDVIAETRTKEPDNRLRLYAGLALGVLALSASLLLWRELRRDARRRAQSRTHARPGSGTGRGP